MEWGAKFVTASRAHFRSLDEQEAAEPDSYVCKPATGAARVHINDFESRAEDFARCADCANPF